MSRRDLLSWLLALAVVGAIIAGAFVTLAALRPAPAEFDATDVTGVPWGRDFRLLDEDGEPRSLADFPARWWRCTSAIRAARMSARSPWRL